MKQPPKGPELPPRKSDNHKRRLKKDVKLEVVLDLLARVFYKGHPKHKRHPHLFGLEPFNGNRGDSTLCDEDANFDLTRMAEVPSLIERGLRARLVGSNALLWTVADDGWIFEGRLTNPVTLEYHGYPVRQNEAIAKKVCFRYWEWAFISGGETDQEAALKCAALYKLKPPIAHSSYA